MWVRIKLDQGSWGFRWTRGASALQQPALQDHVTLWIFIFMLCTRRAWASQEGNEGNCKWVGTIVSLRKDLLRLISKYQVECRIRSLASGWKVTPLHLGFRPWNTLGRWLPWKSRGWGSVLLPHHVTWWFRLSCNPGELHTWPEVIPCPSPLTGGTRVRDGIPSTLTARDGLYFKN